MTTVSLQNLDSLTGALAHLSALYPSASSAPSRADAMQRLTRLGFPTTRHEEWKYTSLRSLLEQNLEMPTRTNPDIQAFLAAHDAAAAEDIRITLVDGQLGSASSLPQGLTLRPMQESEIRHLDATFLTEENEAFTTLNQAFLGGGLILEWLPHTQVQRPIHVVHVVTTERGLINGRLHIRLGKFAQGDVVQYFCSPQSSAYVQNTVTTIDLQEGSALAHSMIQEEGTEAFSINRSVAHVEKFSKLETFHLSLGGRLARNNLDIRLIGAGAEARLDGLYVVRGKQHMDHHTSVVHACPETLAAQTYKGLIFDHGRAVFNGKIFVKPKARLTKSFQSNKNLLLSEHGEVDTKPQLQIDNDDVRCSHGATVGHLNEDEVFYLRSRGIPKATAEHMLCRAFADELVGTLSSLTTRAAVKRRLDTLFGEGLWT